MSTNINRLRPGPLCSSAPGSSDAETKTATPAATGRQSPSRWGDRTNLDGFHLNAWAGCVHNPYF